MADRGSPQLVRGDAVELAKPIIQVRELVETFRSHRIVVDDWQDVVHRAILDLRAFERSRPAELPALARIVTELDVLLDVGWSVDAQVLDTVSAELAELMPRVVPASMPRPGDGRSWAF